MMWKSLASATFLLLVTVTATYERPVPTSTRRRLVLGIRRCTAQNVTDLRFIGLAHKVTTKDKVEANYLKYFFYIPGKNTLHIKKSNLVDKKWNWSKPISSIRSFRCVVDTTSGLTTEIILNTATIPRTIKPWVTNPKATPHFDNDLLQRFRTAFRQMEIKDISTFKMECPLERRKQTGLGEVGRDKFGKYYYMHPEYKIIYPKRAREGTENWDPPIPTECLVNVNDLPLKLEIQQDGSAVAAFKIQTSGHGVITLTPPDVKQRTKILKKRFSKRATLLGEYESNCYYLFDNLVYPKKSWFKHINDEDWMEPIKPTGFGYSKAKYGPNNSVLATTVIRPEHVWFEGYQGKFYTNVTITDIHKKAFSVVPKLEAKTPVRIKNLQNKAELNGQYGIVVGRAVTVKGRFSNDVWKVKIDGEAKPRNFFSKNLAHEDPETRTKNLLRKACYMHRALEASYRDL